MNETVPSVKLICRSLIQRNKSLIVLITCIILFLQCLQYVPTVFTWEIRFLLRSGIRLISCAFFNCACRTFDQ